MKTLIVGLGVQGYKRKKFSKKDYVGSVDPINKSADYKSINEVPLKSYDSVLICTPDNKKLNILNYCLKNKKHVLLEKPLIIKKNKFKYLKKISQKNKLILYTAYNHRFEPHFIKIRNLIKSRKLGKIYYCKIFYGNGTASLVRKSWRDKKNGIVIDIGSHLLDTCLFWFGKKIGNFKLKSLYKLENKSSDHAIIANNGKIKIQLEMTYCMWRNEFRCDVIGEKGSAHITSLCKWGPSIFTHRKRVFPSGKPIEYKRVIKKKDPTWDLEYKYFKKLIKKRKKNNFLNDIWILNQLGKINKNI